MSESGPFRDGMNAALLRIDRLAGENAELRDELARLRERAHETKTQSSDQHANTLADQTLSLLDRLDAQMSAQRTEAEALPVFTSPTELEAHAEAEVLVASKRPQTATLAPPNVAISVQPRKASRAGAIAACAVCLVLGFALGHLF